MSLSRRAPQSLLALSCSALSLFACTELLEPPQLCYSDSQCPAHMSCVDSECALKSARLSYEFKDLGRLDMSPEPLDMRMDMDMAPPDVPYRVKSPVCEVWPEDVSGDLVELEVIAEDNLPLPNLVNQHKFFCNGEQLGLFGYPLFPKPEEQDMDELRHPDSNLLALNLLKADGTWEGSELCAGAPFPLIEGRGLTEVRPLNEQDIELRYELETGERGAKYMSLTACNSIPKLPARPPEGYSFDVDNRAQLSSTAVGEELTAFTWIHTPEQEPLSGAVSLDQSGQSYGCATEIEFFSDDEVTDLWGVTLGGAWMSWLSLIKLRTDQESDGPNFFQLMITLQRALPETLSSLTPCDSLTSLRVGSFIFRGGDKEQRAWRRLVSPLQADPDRGELFFCNYGSDQRCKLSRWSEETGSQWLRDELQEYITLEGQMTYKARANRLVTVRAGEQKRYEIKVYKPCESEEATDGCFQESDQLSALQLADYQIVLFEKEGSRVPYLVRIERDRSQDSESKEVWVLKRTRL